MNQALVIKDDMSLSELGAVFVKSGFFQDARDASQAIVKILAGREMGFGPIASMTGIYIVKGKPSMGANLIAAAIKRSGRYDYRVKSLTDEGCQIDFLEIVSGKRELLGTSSFTLTDARRAGTQNTDKFPRNMLFARAMSNGAKWFCADVFGGPIYTPEELGATVDENGDTVGSLQWTEPIASTQDAKIADNDLPTSDLPATDDSLAHVVDQDAEYDEHVGPQDEPIVYEIKPEKIVEAPKPTNSKTPKLAALRTPKFAELVKAVGAKTKHYRDDNHIRAAAVKLGFAEISNSNLSAVTTALIQHGLEQDAVKDAPK